MTEGPYFLVKSETLLPLMGSEMWQGEQGGLDQVL